MPVYKPSELHKLGHKAKKSLSQNFLIDQNIIKKIIHASAIQPKETVLEIGPGPGALTELLLKNDVSVIAIEKDTGLAKELERLQTEDGRLTIYSADALKFPIEEILPNDSPTKVVANLPYHITTPLITKLLSLYPKIDSLTIMVQKEVGERMTAKKNTSAYSSFTLFLQALAEVRYCFTVKPTSFYPSPSVHSCVIHMKLHPFPFPFPSDLFFAFVRKTFQQKRKMLRSSLKPDYSPDEVEKCLEKLGLTKKARPQELSLENFASLFLDLHPQYGH